MADKKCKSIDCFIVLAILNALQGDIPFYNYYNQIENTKNSKINYYTCLCLLIFSH